MFTTKKSFFIITYFIIYTPNSYCMDSDSYCMSPGYVPFIPTQYPSPGEIVELLFNQNTILAQQNKDLMEQNENLQKQFDHTNLILQQTLTNNIRTSSLMLQTNLIVSTEFARSTIRRHHKKNLRQIRAVRPVDQSAVTRARTKYNKQLDDLDKALADKINILRNNKTNTDKTQ